MQKIRLSICGPPFFHALRTFELLLLFLWHDVFDGTVVIILSKSISLYTSKQTATDDAIDATTLSVASSKRRNDDDADDDVDDDDTN